MPPAICMAQPVQGQEFGCQGYGRGTVYKLMHSNGVWTSSIVYNFQGPEGDGIP